MKRNPGVQRKMHHTTPYNACVVLCVVVVLWLCCVVVVLWLCFGCVVVVTSQCCGCVVVVRLAKHPEVVSVHCNFTMIELHVRNDSCHRK